MRRQWAGYVCTGSPALRSPACAAFISTSSAFRPRRHLAALRAPARLVSCRVWAALSPEEGNAPQQLRSDDAPSNSVAGAMGTSFPAQPAIAPQRPGLEGNSAALDPRVLFGEFLSTFLFVYLSVNSLAGGTQLNQSLNNGAVIAAVAASFMPVSGAHLNPAVTLALAVTDRVSAKRALAFVPIQLLASIAATMLAHALGVPIIFPGVPTAASRADIVHALFDELIPMFLIVAVVFQTAVASEEEGGVGGKLAALYIGLIVLACAGSFSGVFNPARAFGPAFVTRNFFQHWVFWAGPLIGATAAAVTCEHLFLAPAGNRKPKSWLYTLSLKTAGLKDKARVLGLAGIIAYGLLNILFYGVMFPVMLYKIGSVSTSSLAKAWLMSWGLSNATKPIRLILVIAIAPVIQRLLKSWRARRGVVEPGEP